MPIDDNCYCGLQYWVRPRPFNMGINLILISGLHSVIGMTSPVFDEDVGSQMSSQKSLNFS
jgi:hypothetical protein